MFVFLFVCHMAVFVHVEDDVTWGESLWQTWQTFTTVGYGNRPAESWLGRLNSMVFSTLGIAVMGTLFAAAFDMKIYFSNLKRYGQMSNPFKNGYVVVHYPGADNFATFVNEIRSIEPNVGICLLDPNLEELPPRLTHFNRLHLVRASCTDRASFEKAGLRHNKTVLVFSPRIGQSGADAMTKTVVSLISQFLEDSETRLIHMLEDTQNDWMFKQERSVQIIEDLNILAAVQECSDPFSSQMVESMLRNTEGPSIKTVPASKFAHWSWHQFCQSLLTYGEKTGRCVTPLGLIRDNHALASPTPSESIQPSDFCALIFANDLDWPNVESQLLKK